MSTVQLSMIMDDVPRLADVAVGGDPVAVQLSMSMIALKVSPGRYAALPNVIVTAGAVLSIRGSGAAGRDIAGTSTAPTAGYEYFSSNACWDRKVAKMVGGQPQGDTWNVLHRVFK